MLVVLTVNVFIVRYLGPEKYGMLSYALSFVGLFVAISSLGLDEIIVRELVRNPESYNEILGTTFILKASGTVVMVVLLTVGINIIKNDIYTNIMIFIIGASTIFQVSNVIDNYFQSKVLSRYVVQIQLVQVIISSLFKMFLIFIQAPLIWFALAIALDGLILSIGLLVNFRRYTGHLIKITFDRILAINFLRDSWPLIFAGVMVSIYMKIDQVMIKIMIDEKAVGIYAAAVSLSEAWYFIPMVITSSLFPAIINAKKVSDEFYYDRLEKLYKLIVWVPILISIIITYFSEWIIITLYRETFVEAAKVLSIHIWASIFVFLGVASSKWMMVENLQILTLIRTITGMIVNVILNLYLIPEYGITGAAYATFISYFVATFSFALMYHNEKVRINFRIMLKSFLPYLTVSKLGK